MKPQSIDSAMANHRRGDPPIVLTGTSVDHAGWWVWSNGSEFVWLCADDCPHTDHEETADLFPVDNCPSTAAYGQLSCALGINHADEHEHWEEDENGSLYRHATWDDDEGDEGEPF